MVNPSADPCCRTHGPNGDIMKKPPKNRHMLKRSGTVAASLAAAVNFCAPATASGSAKRPNIIFIMLDDMGYGDVVAYGQKHIQMPNIDRMVREGMRYTNVYAELAGASPPPGVDGVSVFPGLLSKPQPELRDSESAARGGSALPSDH